VAKRFRFRTRANKVSAAVELEEKTRDTDTGDIRVTDTGDTRVGDFPV
jgi:hypothetical protein